MKQGRGIATTSSPLVLLFLVNAFIGHFTYSIAASLSLEVASDLSMSFDNDQEANPLRKLQEINSWKLRRAGDTILLFNSEEVAQNGAEIVIPYNITDFREKLVVTPVVTILPLSCEGDAISEDYIGAEETVVNYDDYSTTGVGVFNVTVDIKQENIQKSDVVWTDMFGDGSFGKIDFCIRVDAQSNEDFTGDRVADSILFLRTQYSIIVDMTVSVAEGMTIEIEYDYDTISTAVNVDVVLNTCRCDDDGVCLSSFPPLKQDDILSFCITSNSDFSIERIISGMMIQGSLASYFIFDSTPSIFTEVFVKEAGQKFIVRTRAVSMYFIPRDYIDGIPVSLPPVNITGRALLGFQTNARFLNVDDERVGSYGLSFQVEPSTPDMNSYHQVISRAESAFQIGRLVKTAAIVTTMIVL